jgi:trehalose synthase
MRAETSFFHFTKALHNALHGVDTLNDLTAREARAEYERVSSENAAELLALVKPNDVVLLHDPQTAGLAPILRGHGAHVIWRCHVGSDEPNEPARVAYRFLARYICEADVCVFTRQAYVPENVPLRNVRVIAPTIDPLSAKNQPLSPEVTRAILVHAGLFEGPPPPVVPEFTLEDGSLSRVNRAADVIRLGRACCGGQPLVVQISRWDRLKDHVGVLQGFAQYVQRGGEAHLILAGPNVHAVADDPEGAAVFGEVLEAYRALPHGVRAHVELANLPMADAEENAAIVNALQRQAAVVVQKSLREGFGLTVAEAMWKAKPVIASRIGGIQDQIEDGVSGILLDDPRDVGAFADALERVLSDADLAHRLGSNARDRVCEQFLSLRSLYAHADVIVELLDRLRASE